MDKERDDATLEELIDTKLQMNMEIDHEECTRSKCLVLIGCAWEIRTQIFSISLLHTGNE